MSIRDMYLKHRSIYSKDDITAFLEEFKSYCEAS